MIDNMPTVNVSGLIDERDQLRDRVAMLESELLLTMRERNRLRIEVDEIAGRLTSVEAAARYLVRDQMRGGRAA